MPVSKLPRSRKVTAGLVRNSTFSYKHRKARERQETLSVRKKEKSRRTREIRSKMLYQKLATSIKSTFKPSASKPCSTATFVGHWRPVNCPIKGSDRGSAKKVWKELSRDQRDVAQVVNEYLSSKLCPYCWQETSSHVYTRDGRLVRVNGAKHCDNPLCPGRSIATINRDSVGANNIATIGITMAMSKDGRSLPPFHEGHAKPTGNDFLLNYQSFVKPPMVRSYLNLT